MKNLKFIIPKNNKSLKIIKDGVSALFIKKVIEAQKETLNLENSIKSEI